MCIGWVWPPLNCCCCSTKLLILQLAARLISWFSSTSAIVHIETCWVKWAHRKTEERLLLDICAEISIWTEDVRTSNSSSSTPLLSKTMLAKRVSVFARIDHSFGCCSLLKSTLSSHSQVFWPATIAILVAVAANTLYLDSLLWQALKVQRSHCVYIRCYIEALGPAMHHVHNSADDGGKFDCYLLHLLK